MSDETDKVFTNIADGVTPLPRFSRTKDGFTRNDVVNAFQTAFDMIGGVPRLVLWADRNQTEFYRLYSKLLPATTVVLGETGRTVIEHALAPTALDRHPGDDSRALTLDMPVEATPFQEVKKTNGD